MTELFITGFISIRLLDVIDILLVTLLLYELYNLLRGTVAINIFIGIVAVFLIWIIVSALEMELLSEILGAFISVGFIALIVIFQPEIRKFLLALGTPTFIRRGRTRFMFWRINMKQDSELEIDKVIVACQRMSDSREGALIVITNENELRQYIETGEKIDAVVSTPLIENIFWKNSPMHDGAVIITGNKILAAGCILPVSNNRNLPKRLGLRHRAGVGITEQTDAIAVIVSEQTGAIAYSKLGEIHTRVKPQQLKDFLEEEFAPNKNKRDYKKEKEREKEKEEE